MIRWLKRLFADNEQYPVKGVIYRGGKQPSNPPPRPTAQAHPPKPPRRFEGR